MAQKPNDETLSKPIDAQDVCGIVMPISAIDDCTEAHWSEVLGIISDAIVDANLRPNLVSNADDVGIIQKRIIQNLYDNPIVVCDVISKNPNVMFELGMRLAFDKPTIIIKDDKTSYSFDTSPIEHITYPRDLRFSQIVNFKKELTNKVVATLMKSKSDTKFTTFLKHFGDFTVVEIGTKEISQQEFLSEELSDIRRTLRSLDLSMRRSGLSRPISPKRSSLCLEGLSDAQAQDIVKLAGRVAGVRSVDLDRVGNHFHLYVRDASPTDSEAENVRSTVAQLVSRYRNRNE